jgi:hypothetical protein
MPLPIGVLRSWEAESNCAVTHPTLTFHCPLCQTTLFYFLYALLCVSWHFRDVCMLDCLSKLVLGIHAAKRSYETSANFFQTTQRHIRENCILYSYRCKNYRSH